MPFAPPSVVLVQPEIRGLFCTAVAVVLSLLHLVGITFGLHFVQLFIVAGSLLWLARYFASGGGWEVPENPAIERGDVVILTGANSGLGKAAAERLVSEFGARVICACRSAERAQPVVDELNALARAAGNGGSAEFRALDLMSFKSVKAFAEGILASVADGSFPNGVRTLILNAGIMAQPFRALTADGNEPTQQVNHWSGFLLSRLLFDHISGQRNGRIVVLSSFAHWTGNKVLEMDKFNTEATYTGREWPAYGHSKAANVLHARALQNRFAAAGSTSTAYSVHPGGIITNLGRHLVPAWAFPAVKKATLLIFKTEAEGCLTTLFCALDPRATPGRYHANCAVAQHAAFVDSDEAADELWRQSEEKVRAFL